MTEIIIIALSSGFAGVLVSELFKYLKARMTAGADLSFRYLKLADMTADQLEEYVNLARKLDSDNRKLHSEVDKLTEVVKRGTDAILQSSVERNILEERLHEMEVTRQQYREEHEERVTTLENGMRELLVKSQEWENRYNELRASSEQTIRELKEYIKSLLSWLAARGVDDYPQPKQKSLLDTDRNIKLPTKPGKQ